MNRLHEIATTKMTCLSLGWVFQEWAVFCQMHWWIKVKTIGNGQRSQKCRILEKFESEYLDLMFMAKLPSPIDSLSVSMRRIVCLVQKALSGFNGRGIHILKLLCWNNALQPKQRTVLKCCTNTELATVYLYLDLDVEYVYCWSKGCSLEFDHNSIDYIRKPVIGISLLKHFHGNVFI